MRTYKREANCLLVSNDKLESPQKGAPRVVTLNSAQLRMVRRLLDKIDVHELSLEAEGDAVVLILADEKGQNITVTIDEEGRGSNGN